MLPLKVRSGVYLIVSCTCYPGAGVMAGFYFIVIVLCGLFQYGLTIMCYECNSATNSMCLDAKLPDNLKRNCSDHDRGVTHTLCRKIVQHVDYGVNGRLPESRVIRGCGWDETKFVGQCYHRAGYGGRQEVCSCLTDLCNGAQESKATTALLATTALMFIGTMICK